MIFEMMRLGVKYYAMKSHRVVLGCFGGNAGMITWDFRG